MPRLGDERIPFGSTGADAVFESVLLDLVLWRMKMETATRTSARGRVEDDAGGSTKVCLPFRQQSRQIPDRNTTWCTARCGTLMFTVQLPSTVVVHCAIHLVSIAALHSLPLYSP